MTNSNDEGAGLSAHASTGGSFDEARPPRRLWKWGVGGVVALALGLVVFMMINGGDLPIPVIEAREITEVKPPVESDQWKLTDDRIEDKNPTFDSELIARRPWADDRPALDEKGEPIEPTGQINLSAAVIKLDVPALRPDRPDEGQMLVPRPSYADLIASLPDPSRLLASVNLIDAKSKRFDDGLYAAVDLAVFEGRAGGVGSSVQLIADWLKAVGPGKGATAYLAAGLELAGTSPPLELTGADAASARRRVEGFLSSSEAQPLGFYEWNDQLGRCWWFMKFFQQPIGDEQARDDLIAALRSNPELAERARSINGLFLRLTNPLNGLAVVDLVDAESPIDVKAVAQKMGRRKTDVSMFPTSTSRENELFAAMGPIAPGTNLMAALIEAIRGGRLDLTPDENSGWYEHQAFALETLLLPERGAESEKLLLTRFYKKKMLESFQALITKRRETHIRQMGRFTAMAAAPRDPLKPRLRVEPNPTLYLRTARSYAFLLATLEEKLGAETLAGLYGQREEGPRDDVNLREELIALRDLIAGLFLISCDDIGLRPFWSDSEAAGYDAESCLKRAETWLNDFRSDVDLSWDTRVVVPVGVDPERGVYFNWATIGVRLAKLDASFAKPPQVRTAPDQPWEEPPHGTAFEQWLIPVDEFISFESRVLLDRETFRAICDRHANDRQALLNALQR